MSKRKISFESCSAATEPPAKRQHQQHLYLVLDDWEDGYSVHKVDISAFESESGADGHEDMQPKPFVEPPVARFNAVHGNSHAFLTHGTKMVTMKPPDLNPAILAFDTATSAMATLPWPSFRMNFDRPILISITDRIFLFINDIHYLGDPPPPPLLWAIDGGQFFLQPLVKEPCVWTAVGSPQARLPFTASSSFSHALHPDGRTLVVSASKWANNEMEGTFSFNTERLEWACHGGWHLPFFGRAYYVDELDAWVGICCHKGGTRHLCSSDVVSVGAGLTTLPRWKLGEERLFDRESPRHLGVWLVHMGGTRFCFVEYTWHEDDDDIMRRKDDHTGLYVAPLRVVVRITTFSVKHSQDGELRLETPRARSCNVFRRPHGFQDTKPVAFWI